MRHHLLRSNRRAMFRGLDEGARSRKFAMQVGNSRIEVLLGRTSPVDAPVGEKVSDGGQPLKDHSELSCLKTEGVMSRRIRGSSHWSPSDVTTLAKHPASLRHPASIGDENP